MPQFLDRWSRRVEKTWFFPSAVAVMCFLVIIVPLSIGGLHASGDLTVYLSFAQEFRSSLLEGDLFPAWTFDNVGYGGVGLRFYPPMAGLTTALIASLTGSWFYAIWIYFILWLAVGCTGVYLFVRDWSTPQQGLLAGILYAIAPFPVAEIYQFSLYAEFAAGAIVPYCFLYITRSIRYQRWSDAIGLTLSLSVLILTHIPTTIITGFSLFLYALFIIERRAIGNTILKVCTAGSLGLLLTAFYWLPVITELEWLKHNQEKYSTAMAGYQQWIFPHILRAGEAPGYLVPVYRNMDAIIILTVAFLIPYFLILVIDRRGLKERYGRLCASVALVGLFGFFMSSSASAWIWSQFALLQKIQFPWRWMTLTSVLAVASFAFSLPLLLKTYSAVRTFALMGVIGMIALVIVYDVRQSFARLNTISRTEFEDMLRESINPSGTSYEAWWPIWAKSDALKTTDKVTAGARAVEIKTWHRDRRTFAIAPGLGETARIATFFYPHWRARVNGAAAEITHDENGAIVIPLSAEYSSIELYFREPMMNIIASWVSLGTLIILATALLIFGWRNIGRRSLWFTSIIGS